MLWTKCGSSMMELQLTSQLPLKAFKQDISTTLKNKRLPDINPLDFFSYGVNSLECVQLQINQNAKKFESMYGF